MNANEEYLGWLKGVSNKELLELICDQARGDDWEGCFTSRGFFEYSAPREELEKRLKEIKFL